MIVYVIFRGMVPPTWGQMIKACILLAGGTASLPGLTEVVTRLTSFPCQVVNPFDGMDVARTVREKRMQREAPSYLTACGLAMRRFLR